MEHLLEIHDLLVKADDTVILQLADLTVYRGEVMVLLGPNGAGKSTLLQIAAGLKKPTAGQVGFPAAPHLTDLEYRRRVSTVFQSPLLLSDTVENNIASGLKFRGVPHHESRGRVRTWMDLLHITHLARRRINGLSGGEAQRVSLARAFCLQTELILMDEPFSALDTPTRQSLLEDLRAIFSETNQTCIYVTHDLEEALAIGDRIAVLFNGHLHQLSPTQEVFDHPRTPEVAAFMGMENIIPARVQGRTEDRLHIQAGDRLVEAIGDFPDGAQVLFCLRPEDVSLIPSDDPNPVLSGRNRLPCRITALVNQGPFVRIQLSAGFDLVAYVTRSSVQDLNLQVGREIMAVFKASAVHLILNS